MTTEKMLTCYQFHTSPSWQHTQIDLDTKIHTYCHGRLEGVKENKKNLLRKEKNLAWNQVRTSGSKNKSLSQKGEKSRREYNSSVNN